LKDKANLIAGGLSDEDAGTIVDLAKEKGNSVAQAKLKELWPKREAGAVNADPIVIATLDALRLDNPEIGWDDPASIKRAEDAEKRAMQTYGKVLTDLENWAKTNPEQAKDPIKLGEKIHKLTRPYGARNASSVLLPSLPAFDEGMLGESTLLPPPPSNP
jgi:hypothetical protein